LQVMVFIGMPFVSAAGAPAVDDTRAPQQATASSILTGRADAVWRARWSVR
jgi:hypothetical protein